MVVHKPKAAPPVRMEELRALNMLKLDPDDAKARIEQAQKPRNIVPSGGSLYAHCSITFCMGQLGCAKEFSSSNRKGCHLAGCWLRGAPLY